LKAERAERDIYMELFNISINTYYLWKKQGRLIISLLEKYFTKEDLEEFLVSGKVAKLENLNLVHAAAQKIVREFFYTTYTNNKKNDEFLTIFPLYVEFENQRVANHKKIFHDKMAATQNDEQKKEISHKIYTIYAKYNKRDLIRFIVETEVPIDKTSALFEISHLSDLEIHLLVSEYKKFIVF
jgi:hypothetical protein